METCQYCGKETTRVTAHLAHCTKYKDWRDKTLTKEFLETEYVKKEKAAIEIANDLGMSSASSIIKALRKHKIKTRSIKESKTKQRTKDKTKKTNLLRYGAEHNFSKNHPSRIEWEKRLQDEEGIINVFQRDSVKRKIISTCIEKYGASHHMKSKDFLKEYFDNFEEDHGYRYPIKSPNNKFGGCISKPQKKVIKELRKNGIDLKTEFSVYPYRVDILIKGTNKIIEVNGDYWHANPEKYKAEDLLSFPKTKRKILAKEIWEKDKKRLSYIRSAGFQVFEVWENEINKKLENTINNIFKFIDDEIPEIQFYRE